MWYELLSDYTFRLVVSGSAIRRGEASIALGDLMGASFVDATLSLGIGPLLFPGALSESAVRGSLVATIVATLTGIGLIFLLPVITWGGTFFALRMHDGGAEMRDLFAGFSIYGTALVGMLVPMVVLRSRAT